MTAGPAIPDSVREAPGSLALSVAVAVVPGVSVEALRASLFALAAAIDTVERLRYEVEVVIADATSDPIVARLLATVEGATVITVRDSSIARAWTAACERTSAPAVLLTSPDAAVGEDALHLLATALDTEPAAAAAVPYPDPGAYALVRRSTLGADEDVAALLERLHSNGASVARTAGAGALRRRTRTIVGPGRFPGVTTVMARSDALTVGEASYVGPGGTFQTYAPVDRIELGAYCSVADNVRFINPGGRLWGPDGTELQLLIRGLHRPDSASTFPIGILVPEAPYDDGFPAGATGEAQIIGNDVWIGYGATILGGVTVGTGAIIGACSLVRSDVPPYTIVGGTPARQIRRRFTEDVAERLQRIAWWDWQPELVRANWWWFTRPVEEFVRRFDPAGRLPAGSAATCGWDD